MSESAVLSVLNTPNTELISRGLASSDLNGCNLSGADLAGLDLSSADLSQADFTEADLAGANLSGADLYRSRLCGAVLTGADLSHADLTSADLRGANLSGADLSGAKLSGGTLADTDLSAAVLRTVDFYEADLSRANLSGADLHGANMSCTKMERPRKILATDLNKAKLFTAIPISATTSTTLFSKLSTLLDKILIFIAWARVRLRALVSFKDRAASWQQFPQSQIVGLEVSDPRQELNITKQSLMNLCRRGDTNSSFERQIEDALCSISSTDEIVGS